MKSKVIEQLKEIKANYKKTKNKEQMLNAIQQLPPEIIELFNEMVKAIKNEKKQSKRSW
jgi:wobble nucleotide-excising tRNase